MLGHGDLSDELDGQAHRFLLGAMAMHRLGRGEEARRRLDRAKEELAFVPPHDRLQRAVLRRLLAEAEQVLAEPPGAPR